MNWKKIKRKIRIEYNVLHYGIFKFPVFQPEQNYLIFSDPRGGSTWLSEILNKIPNTAVIWEPINLRRTPEFEKLNFGWRQFIPENEQWNEAKNLLERSIKGNIPATTFKHSINDFKKADKLIIKFVRGNALLPWLVNQFDFQYLPVYLVRNPFAVVASQQRHGNWSEFHWQKHFPENMAFNEYFTKHLDFLKTLTTPEESLMAIWALSNNVPLNSKNNNIKWITVNYENLLLNSEEELYRIFNRWNQKIPDTVYSQLKIPSKTTKAGSPVSGMKQLEHWKTKFNSDQINKMLEVLKYFEIKAYSDELLPLINYFN